LQVKAIAANGCDKTFYTSDILSLVRRKEAITVDLGDGQGSDQRTDEGRDKDLELHDCEPITVNNKKVPGLLQLIIRAMVRYLYPRYYSKTYLSWR
jgi:hypothetical protein